MFEVIYNNTVSVKNDQSKLTHWWLWKITILHANYYVSGEILLAVSTDNTINCSHLSKIRITENAGVLFVSVFEV